MCVLHVQVNVIQLLSGTVETIATHPLIKTHPERSDVTVVIYGTPHVPFKYKRQMRSLGFRDVIYCELRLNSLNLPGRCLGRHVAIF